MSTKPRAKKVRRKPVDIQEEQIEQIKDAFISLYQQKKLLVDIKVSPTISRKSNCNELMSKTGTSLHKHRKFFHCDDDGSQSPAVKKAFSGLRYVIMEAYRRFTVAVGLRVPDATFDCGILTTYPSCVQQVFLFFVLFTYNMA